MEHNRELLQQIKEDLAKECGWKDFRTMAENVNIVPHDVSYIAKRYAEKHCEDLDSKLHLLQQEYDKLNNQHHRLMADYDVVSDARGEKEEYFDALKKEYDKLKEELDGYKAAQEDHNRLVREIDVILHYDEAAEQASLCDLVGPIAELVEAHAPLLEEYSALKEKAEKMEAMLRDVRKNSRLSVRLEIEIDDCLSSYNSNNQNEK